MGLWMRVDLLYPALGSISVAYARDVSRETPVLSGAWLVRLLALSRGAVHPWAAGTKEEILRRRLCACLARGPHHRPCSL